MDVMQLLKRDHKIVKNLFKEFKGLSDRATQKKSDLVTHITQALAVHAQVEEELVYPAFAEQRSLKGQVQEAIEEHQVAKTLLAELAELPPEDERYNAKVQVLSEYVRHHVKEEEKELFPRAQHRFSAQRLNTLGEQVEERRSALMGEGETLANRKKSGPKRDTRQMA
jgi:hemerythrin superfamily protein